MVATKKAKSARTSKPLVLIDRFRPKLRVRVRLKSGGWSPVRIKRGAWTYRDQAEAELLAWLWPQISLESIDDFIEGRQGVMLPQHMRTELLELRRSAVEAYRSRKHDLAVALAGQLYEKCMRFGQYFAGKPAVVGYKKYRDSQAYKARGRRSARIDDDGNTVDDLITKLAGLREDGEYLSAKELWPKFYAKLDELRLDPKEYEDPTDANKFRIEYDTISGRRPITFKTFQNKLPPRKKSR